VVRLNSCSAYELGSGHFQLPPYSVCGCCFFQIPSARSSIPDGTLVEIDLAAILCAAGNFLGSMFGIVAGVP
jgi:hypothetical protein